MGHSYVIRQLDVVPKEALAAVLELEKEAFPACERLGDGFQPFLVPRTNGLVLAESEDHRVAGYLLFAKAAAIGLITKVAVGAAFQGRGIGTALMQRGIDAIIGVSRRTDCIQLHVDPARASAVRLYERCGFQVASRLPGYYRSGPAAEAAKFEARDALLMQKAVGVGQPRPWQHAARERN